ncbi:CpsD/CapB family tyrosine-protein kinase [Sphingomonas sp.]|uniref:CpsD/CapB family tyrosine-protein kinase n=1 Tax=Sphingomonas sp. TaxID=28214 RepID=UPI002DB99C6D|nr:CpsD/CapB family tyrosine-protein kinase [Sphingomonas sp.]HEU4968149.1 CpsD/CapB family tyrosine-protein kinase [Sphingomonas sp.]
MKTALQEMEQQDASPAPKRDGYELSTTEPAPIESVMVNDPHSIEAEAIRALRTRLAAQHLREGRRSLAICSAAAESGCTYIALNLAVAMAQAGVRTALVDANLRDPMIADLCGLPLSMPGLSEFLANDSIPMAEIVDTELMSNLAVIGGGEAPPNPQELLSGARFRGMVDQLLREYDLTIFDTAPAKICSDALRVATMAGFSLIVSRKHKTYFEDTKTLAKQLRADRSLVVGSILNSF